MITFNNIVSKFQEFCDNHYFIQTFSYGSPSDVDLEKFEQYPLLHLVYTGGDYNSPKAKTYNLEVYILSLPPSKADKVDYQKESISDAEQVAEDILADIQNGGNIFQFGFHYDLVNASVTPLEEERSNALAGCLLDIAISVPYTYDSCNAPITGVEPDGSDIPSFKARGLLRVKELDGSPDVLSVATINVPNGSLVDDGDGEITLTFGGENATRLVQTVKNVSGGRLEKGTPVHAIVNGASGNLAYVIAARADTASAMPATFVLNETLDDEAEGEAIITGLISGVDTSDFSAGDVIYVGETGGYTNTKPTGTNLIQNLGIVLKRHASNGSGIVYGSGRSNDVPNIPEGYGWLGNASGVATPTLFNFYLNRFDDTASTMASTLDAGAATIERIDTARWTGTGVYLSQQSDTPSAGNAIKRKVYYKNEFGSTDAFGTWTLIHEFADDTSYATALAYINDTIIAGQTNGTAPASLVMTWEDTAGFTGLLDDYPGAAAAYSLRLLDSTYTGSAIRVRRASDNTEQDIGFDSLSELDTSALATFCAGTDGFVKTWYSQTGSNDATQTTVTHQPKIYDSVTGTHTVGGDPAVEFLTSDSLSISSVTPTTSFAVAKVNTIDAINYWLFGGDGGLVLAGTYSGINGLGVVQINPSIVVSSITGEDTNRHLGVWNYSGSQYQVAKDGGGLAGLSNTNKLSFTSIARQIDASARLLGSVQEIVLYGTDQSSNRTGIETNINDFYSIF